VAAPPSRSFIFLFIVFYPRYQNPAAGKYPGETFRQNFCLIFLSSGA
jgi:hypothetical protein